VFARTKHGADKIVKQLIRAGIRAAAIHGNKSQNVRQRTLDAFKSNRPPVLVATDVAARGLDVQGISHVINYDLPDVPEMYVHRIGRTARAGESGTAMSFCTPDERQQLRQIERLTRRTLTVEKNQLGHSDEPTAAHTPQQAQGENTTSRSRRGRPGFARRRHTARRRRSAC
jgi:ATP-dependent RNA helicase RhlE